VSEGLPGGDACDDLDRQVERVEWSEVAEHATNIAIAMPNFQNDTNLIFYGLDSDFDYLYPPLNILHYPTSSTTTTTTDS
jgi:hypothetical protein